MGETRREINFLATRAKMAELDSLPGAVDDRNWYRHGEVKDYELGNHPVLDDEVRNASELVRVVSDQC